MVNNIVDARHSIYKRILGQNKFSYCELAHHKRNVFYILNRYFSMLYAVAAAAAAMCMFEDEYAYEFVYAESKARLIISSF